MNYLSLAKTFAATSTIAILSGCATMCDTKVCRLEESARTMVGSDDYGIKAAGARTLIDLHPEIADNSAEVRNALVPKTIECTVGAAKIVNGVKIVPCIKAPSGPK